MTRRFEDGKRRRVRDCDDVGVASMCPVGQTIDVFERSEATREPTNSIADRMAEERLAAARAS